jgi:AraC-like DNA-binding protein
VPEWVVPKTPIPALALYLFITLKYKICTHTSIDMDTRISLYATVLLFAFVQGIIYILLFTKRGVQDNRTSDFWLAALIAALCIFNLHWMLGFMGIHVMGQQLWFFPQSVGLIVGPIVYYYLKTQINTTFRFTKRDFLHFTPYLTYFFYHLIIFSFGDDTIDWWHKTVHTPYRIGSIEVAAEYISLFVYLYLAAQLYRKYRMWLPRERSDTEGVLFDWYRRFLWAVVLGALSAFVVFVIEFWQPLSFQAVWIQRAFIAVLIYYISIAGYSHAQPHNLVFEEEQIEDEPQSAILIETMRESGLTQSMSDTPVPLVKIENRFDADTLELWKQKIEAAMQQEKLYINPELTLSQLSDLLGTHNSLVSYVINTGFEKNFNDFVNEFRINLFKNKINDPKLSHYTLLALAFECGFNSKSTFNRAFKKATGLMPSDFLKR